MSEERLLRFRDNYHQGALQADLSALDSLLSHRLSSVVLSHQDNPRSTAIGFGSWLELGVNDGSIAETPAQELADPERWLRENGLTEVITNDHYRDYSGHCVLQQLVDSGGYPLFWLVGRRLKCTPDSDHCKPPEPRNGGETVAVDRFHARIQPRQRGCGVTSFEYLTDLSSTSTDLVRIYENQMADRRTIRLAEHISNVHKRYITAMNGEIILNASISENPGLEPAASIRDDDVLVPFLEEFYRSQIEIPPNQLSLFLGFLEYRIPLDILAMKHCSPAKEIADELLGIIRRIRNQM